MISLVAASFFFVGLHLLVSGTPVRDAIVRRIGEKIYLGLFSLAALVGLVWMCIAWSAADDVDLWGEIAIIDALAPMAMLIACLLVAIGLTTPSPTAAGGEALLDQEEPAHGILRITRHPFLWGVATWAFTHVIANGDLAAFVFFGAMLVLALMGTRSIDAKRARVQGERWERFASVTSNVPFAAIAGGRNRLAPLELGAWRPAVAVGLFLAFWFSHDWLFDTLL